MRPPGGAGKSAETEDLAVSARGHFGDCWSKLQRVAWAGGGSRVWNGHGLHGRAADVAC